MSWTVFGKRARGTSETSTQRLRRKARRLKPVYLLRGEALEDRTVLATFTVHLVNFAFQPSSLTINVGDTVHWVWDSNFHSTTSVPGIAEQWDSGIHNSEFTFDHTFTQVGSFAYYCQVHGFDNGDGTAGGMSRTITVQNTPTLQSIAVTPANPSVPKGETDLFTATGTFLPSAAAVPEPSSLGLLAAGVLLSVFASR